MVCGIAPLHGSNPFTNSKSTHNTRREGVVRWLVSVAVSGTI